MPVLLPISNTLLQVRIGIFRNIAHRLHLDRVQFQAQMPQLRFVVGHDILELLSRFDVDDEGGGRLV